MKTHPSKGLGIEWGQQVWRKYPGSHEFCEIGTKSQQKSRNENTSAQRMKANRRDQKSLNWRKVSRIEVIGRKITHLFLHIFIHLLSPFHIISFVSKLFITTFKANNSDITFKSTIYTRVIDVYQNFSFNLIKLYQKQFYRITQ